MIGPAKEKVYGDFLKFVQSEEKAFSKVQDFKQEEFEEKQKALEINSRLEAIQEEQRRVEDMMVEEMEAHQQQAMKLNQEYNERIDKMKEEEKYVATTRIHINRPYINLNSKNNFKLESLRKYSLCSSSLFQS